MSWSELSAEEGEATEDESAPDDAAAAEAPEQAEMAVSPIESLDSDVLTPPSDLQVEPEAEIKAAPKKPKSAGPKGLGPSFDMDFTIDKSVKKPKD